ncbi:unnamed protein product [Ilex paraguariensis]|uniref:TPX2 central domain-containing protein n=1 Tax=Ilex paraguariensis TaxID=185542 RepID=A0ABC8QWX1_9AQUA
MDEEMEDFIEECFEVSEFDPGYEYDSARFFDFTRPETNSETDEAERWFEFAGSYPPSPFIVKLNLGNYIIVEDVNASPHLEHASASLNSNGDIDSKVSTSEESDQGLKYHTCMAQDISKAKRNSMAKSVKPRSSTLMKPTASHLAKQNKAQDPYLNRFCGRSQKPRTKVAESNVLNSPPLESEATKRQKLESGYLLKVAHLKHQTLLLHKMAKKRAPSDSNSVNSRSKGTIPREPDLETAQRAQRRSFRSKNSFEPGEQAKRNARMFKARPLNRKILEAPSLSLPKKSTPKLPEFQVFHLKTMERAMQHSSANVLNSHNPDSVVDCESTDFRRLNPEDASKQQKERLPKSKVHPFSKKIFPSKGDNVIRNSTLETTDCQFPSDNRLPQNPPIELFSKLSLKSGLENNTISQPKQHGSVKGSKENAPCPFQLEFCRRVGKLNQCGSDRRFPEIGSQPNINRSLDIR